MGYAVETIPGHVRRTTSAKRGRPDSKEQIIRYGVPAVHRGYDAVGFGIPARRADRRPGLGRGHYGILQVRLKNVSELHGWVFRRVDRLELLVVYNSCSDVPNDLPPQCRTDGRTAGPCAALISRCTSSPGVNRNRQNEEYTSRHGITVRPLGRVRQASCCRYSINWQPQRRAQVDSFEPLPEGPN